MNTAMQRLSDFKIFASHSGLPPEWIEDWADDFGGSIDQNWETETTTVTFEDGSRIVWSGQQITAEGPAT